MRIHITPQIDGSTEVARRARAALATGLTPASSLGPITLTGTPLWQRQPKTVGHPPRVEIQ